MVSFVLCDRSGGEAGEVDLDQLCLVAEKAHPLCLAQAKEPDSPLQTLTEIELTLVTDKVITAVHAEFLDDPTPTDVITFHHGELLISPMTALRQGAIHAQPLQNEVSLYAVHGLLHLAGHEDYSEEGATTMRRLQEAILEQVLAS